MLFKLTGHHFRFDKNIEYATVPKKGKEFEDLLHISVFLLEILASYLSISVPLAPDVVMLSDTEP